MLFRSSSLLLLQHSKRKINSAISVATASKQKHSLSKIENNDDPEKLSSSVAIASNNTNNNSIPWQQALEAFRHQLFAGQELTPDLARRVTTIFERQGDAADLLRWWILFRCEKVPPTVSEARALLYHNMWKQALYTSVIATSPPRYTEFGHHAAIATCRSGNWRLALQLCEIWEEHHHKDENILSDGDGEEVDENNLNSSSSSSSQSAFLTAASMKFQKRQQQQQQDEKEVIISKETSKDEIEVSAVSREEVIMNLTRKNNVGGAAAVPSWAVALNAMLFANAARNNNTNNNNKPNE